MLYHPFVKVIILCCFLIVPVVTTSIVGTSIGSGTTDRTNQNYDHGTIMINVNNDNYQYFTKEEQQQPLQHSIQIQYSSSLTDDDISVYTRFKLFLSPKDFPSLCGNIQSLMLENSNNNSSTFNNNNNSSTSSSSSIQDNAVQHNNKEAIGLVVPTSDNDNNDNSSNSSNNSTTQTICTLEEQLANADYINQYYLSSSIYYIQYLVINDKFLDTNYNVKGNNSDIDNTTTENNITTTPSTSSSSTTILYASNTTIDTIQLSIIKYATAISSSESSSSNEISISPYLLDSGYTNWNIEYIITNLDEKRRQQQMLFGGGGYNSTSNAISAISFAIFNLIFLLCIVIFIARAIRRQQQRLIDSNAYGNGTNSSTTPLGFLYNSNVSNQMEHQRQIQEEQYNNQIIHRLTQNEFDSLPVLQYEKGIYDKLKHITILQLQQLQKDSAKVNVSNDDTDNVDKIDDVDVTIHSVSTTNNVANSVHPTTTTTASTKVNDNASVSSVVDSQVRSEVVATTTIPILVDDANNNKNDNNSSTSTAITATIVDEQSESSISRSTSNTSSTRMFRNMITGLSTTASSSSSPRRFITNTSSGKQQDTMTTANSSTHKNTRVDLDVEEGGIIDLDSTNTTTDRNLDDTCPICIDNFTNNECVIILPRCSHIYHKECLCQWLLNKDGCCPICKVYVLTDEQIQSRSKQ